MKTTGTPDELLQDIAARKACARREHARLPYAKKLEIVEKLYIEFEPLRLAREENKRQRSGQVPSLPRP